jgi:hypothetical protein
MDVEDQIPPTLPLQKGGIPLFGKEGLGEIFTTICLFNYGLLSNYVPCIPASAVKLTSCRVT